MPADALHCFYSALELNEKLSSGKIEKITMPEKDEIVLSVRCGGKTHSLILSADPSCARCHLTGAGKPNPITAPAFLMHLRKHIGGGKIESIYAPDFERMIVFKIRTHNELAVEDSKMLIAEIMGKFSNLILVGSDNTISESIRHVSLDTSSKRQVLPGLKYEPPPKQEDKISVFETALLQRHLEGFDTTDLKGYVLKRVLGLAPSSIFEAIFQAGLKDHGGVLSKDQINTLIQSLQSLYSVSDKKPCVLFDEGKAKDFFIRPYQVFDGTNRFFESLNAAEDEYYYSIDKLSRFKNKSRHLLSVAKNALASAEKKLNIFLERQDECANLESDKLCGELLTVNLYKLKTPSDSVTVENYYDENRPIEIKLEKNKSPQQNAQSYFRRYAKKKKTLAMLVSQIENVQNEISYVQSLLLSFEICSETEELDELTKEMEWKGLLKAKDKKKASKQEKPSAPITVEVDGFKISVGKNNFQNDRLTKSAAESDIWLHTQKIHGSHVVISAEKQQVPENVLLSAASLAAFYSKGAQAQKVPVDYTLVKYVSKPAGSPPGKVIYTNQSTIYAQPKNADAFKK